MKLKCYKVLVQAYCNNNKMLSILFGNKAYAEYDTDSWCNYWLTNVILGKKINNQVSKRTK